jgi:TRAP-type uncharacterized transport system fused permease subunit
MTGSSAGESIDVITGFLSAFLSNMSLRHPSYIRVVRVQQRLLLRTSLFDSLLRENERGMSFTLPIFVLLVLCVRAKWMPRLLFGCRSIMIMWCQFVSDVGFACSWQIAGYDF